MVKILSLIFINLFALLIFLAKPPPTHSLHCVLNVGGPFPASGSVNVQITGEMLTNYWVGITDETDTNILAAESGNTGNSNTLNLTINLPAQQGTYNIGAWSGAGSTVHACSGKIQITTETDVSSCAGFLGCIGGISSPTTKFGVSTLVESLVGSMIPIVLGIIGFITVIIIIISGIQFITSSGNPEAAGAARSRLTLAIVGFVIVVLAFAITQIIDKIFLGGSGVF